jgi:toxin ParE1/3/4
VTAFKSTYRLSAPAFRDLQEIEVYIADHNPVAAEKVIGTIKTTCDMLAHEPQAGRKRPELDPRLRSFVVGQYVVFYAEQNTSIDIIRILHSRRDIEAIMTGDAATIA